MLYIYIIYSWKVETINQLTFCPLCLGQSSWAAPKYQTCAGCLSPTLDLSARRPFEPAFSCAQHILGDCGTPKGRTFVSFIHISSLSPALKCLAILTLARSWSSLVKQFETCWNCVSLSLAKICRAFGLSLNPLPSRVDPKWVSEWQMHHRGLNWYLKQHEPQAICNLWDFRIFQASSFGSFPSHQTCSIAGLLISKTSSKSGSNGGISWGNLLLRL